MRKSSNTRDREHMCNGHFMRVHSFINKTWAFCVPGVKEFRVYPHYYVGYWEREG